MRWLVGFSLMTLVCLTPFSFLAAQDPPKGPPPAKVVVSKVFTKDIAPTTQMIGVLDFDRQSHLSAEISGLVQHQAVTEGRVVRKNDLLYRLDTELVEKELVILEKRVAQIEVRIGNARKNVTRYQSLLERNATSEKAYDDLFSGLQDLLMEKEIVLQTSAKRTLELNKSQLRAPFDGLVLKRHKDIGEWVSPGVPVCILAAIDSTMVRVAVPENVVRFVAPGQTLDLTIDALEKTLQGRVQALVPVADPASKTVQIKVAIAYQPKTAQNMTVRVHVPVGPKQTLRMIPRDALVSNQGKNFIYTPQDNKAHMLPIRIAAYQGQYVGVDDPQITEGMAVVVDGNERLRPGQSIRPVFKE